MDENQWVTEQRSAQFMVRQLSKLCAQRTKVGRRKHRLFACGCVRQVWHLLGDDRLRDAVEIAERFADGHGTKASLHERFTELRDLALGDFDPNASGVVQRTAAALAVGSLEEHPGKAAFEMTVFPLPLAGVSVGSQSGGQVLCDLLRCVFGNPFLQPAFNKKWRSETVTALATSIYAERAFDRLPILADALEETGCDDPAMLSHLRGPGPHCRGCWVLVLALGK